MVITAGPTYEKIDPVRFIGNFSSGKMGAAIADECIRRGAKVVLVAGPQAARTESDKLCRIDVESAREMCDATLREFADADVAVFSAAVADYRPENCVGSKMKREGVEEVEIRLVRNPDIARECGMAKRKGQFTVGFALETDNERTNAIAKLEKKTSTWWCSIRCAMPEPVSAATPTRSRFSAPTARRANMRSRARKR